GLLQALPLEAAPVSDVLIPHEACWFAPAPNTICVAVEPIVALNNNPEVLILGLGVGGPAGTDSPLECHLVGANGVVARLVAFAVVLAPLIDQHDPARPGCGSHRIADHLHVLRRGNDDISSPEPASVPTSIIAHHVPADHRVERNLMEDSHFLI